MGRMTKKHLISKSTVILAVFLLAGSVPADEPGRKSPKHTSLREKNNILQMVAKNWIEIGKAQFKRNLYLSAEQSFLHAQDTGKYLSDEQKTNLQKWLKKTHVAAVERQSTLKKLELANRNLVEGDLLEARQIFESCDTNQFLQPGELEKIREKLDTLNKKIRRLSKTLATLFQKSVHLYHEGELKKAREAFARLAKSNVLSTSQRDSARDYLAKIDEILSDKMAASLGVKPELQDEAQPAKQMSQSDINRIENQLLKLQNADTENKEKQPVEKNGAPLQQKKKVQKKVINKRTRVLQSYMKTLVTTATQKANAQMLQGNFYNAKKIVESAKELLYQKSELLPEDFYRLHSAKLEKQLKKIIEAKNMSLN